MNGYHAETVIEVFTEPAFGDFRFEIFVGGGNHADVYIGFFGAAERSNFSFLQNTVELHLHREAHVADFVHEKRAAVRSLKEAAPVFVCARKGAAHVSEEF